MIFAGLKTATASFNSDGPAQRRPGHATGGGLQQQVSVYRLRVLVVGVLIRMRARLFWGLY